MQLKRSKVPNQILKKHLSLLNHQKTTIICKKKTKVKNAFQKKTFFYNTKHVNHSTKTEEVKDISPPLSVRPKGAPTSASRKSTPVSEFYPNSGIIC